MSRFSAVFARVASTGLLRRRWVRIALYAVFYVVCLFLFVRFTFPYDSIKQRIVGEYNASQKERKLEIEDLSGYWLFGVSASGVRLTEVPSAASQLAAADGEKASPKPLEIETLRMSPSILSYLFGNVVVSFSADLGGGELQGSFEQSDAEARLRLEGEEVDISGVALLESLVGLPLGGVLAVNVDVVLPERKAQKAEGKFELSIAELSIGDGKAKVRNTIALPRLNAGDLVVSGQITAGRLDFSDFSANGSDFELKGEGRVRLREPFDRSALDLDLGFKFKEAYVTKSDMTKSIFGSPDGKVPGLFDMDPQVRQSKAEDGFYRWRVSGQLVHPAFRPGGGVKRPSKSKGAANDEP